MAAGADSDDLALVVAASGNTVSCRESPEELARLAPIRTSVAHLVGYSDVPHPWDDADVGGRVNNRLRRTRLRRVIQATGTADGTLKLFDAPAADSVSTRDRDRDVPRCEGDHMQTLVRVVVALVIVLLLLVVVLPLQLISMLVENDPQSEPENESKSADDLEPGRPDSRGSGRRHIRVGGNAASNSQ